MTLCLWSIKAINIRFKVIKLLRKMRPTLIFVTKINKNKEMTNISIKKYLDEISAPQHLAFPLKNK
jgi:hypothetical protein